MAKLIHSPLLSYVKASNKLYNSSITDGSKYIGDALSGVIFTDDGYIVAKGHEYYIGTAIPGALNSSSGIALNSDGKTLEIYDANGNKLTQTATLPIYELTNGNLTTVTDTGGSWKVDHNVIWNGSSYIGASADNSDSILVPDIDVDTYGHISGITNRTATLNKVKSTALTSAATLYLLGHSEAGTSEVLYDTSVYFTKTTGTNGTVVLTVPKLTVTSGGTGVALGTGTGAKTLEEYIADRITANDAMVFKGTIGTDATVSALPLTTSKIGWTYKVKTAGWIKTDGTFTTTKPSNSWQAVEVGDMVMCVVDGTTSTTAVNSTNWTIVQVNIDGQVITNGNFTTNGVAYATGNNTITTTGVGTAGQYLRSTGSGAPTWDTFKSLSLFGQSYEPYNTALTITCGRGINLDANKVLGHSNSVTKVETAGLYKITYDEYGHITSSTTSWTPNNLTFSGVKSSTYNGTALSTAPIFNVDGTGNVTTFAADRGLVLYGSATGITIGHSTNITEQTSSKLGSILFDKYGHITSFTEVTSLKNPNSLSIFGKSYDGSSSLTISLGTNLSLGSDNKLNATNTWRPVYGYTLETTSTLAERLSNDPESTGAKMLQFGSEFVWTENDTNGVADTAEIHLAWAEVGSDGKITYSV